MAYRNSSYSLVILCALQQLSAKVRPALPSPKPGPEPGGASPPIATQARRETPESGSSVGTGHGKRAWRLDKSISPKALCYLALSLNDISQPTCAHGDVCLVGPRRSCCQQQYARCPVMRCGPAYSDPGQVGKESADPAAYQKSDYAANRHMYNIGTTADVIQF